MTLKTFFYRLFFTRDDDLDLLQFMFMIWLFFLGYLLVRIARGEWTLPADGWVLIRTVFFFLFLTGAPTWIVKEVLTKWPPGSGPGAPTA